jgi:hypothetical protein
MSVRGQLKSVKILLEETRVQTAPIAIDNAAGIAERLQELHDRIEQQPQISAVRPASIALHNLIVSLRRQDTLGTLSDEIDSALEALEDLLDDHTFGVSRDDLRVQVESALRERGVGACTACKHPHLTIELAYVLIKPFPSDAMLPPSQLPCAMIVCKRCGLWWMHDLAVLGLL